MPRRRERRAAATLIVALLLPVVAVATEPVHDADKGTNAGTTAGGSGGGLFDLGQMSKSKEPIIITSDTLEYDYKANVVVYRGDVAAAQGQVKLRSDTL